MVIKNGITPVSIIDAMGTAVLSTLYYLALAIPGLAVSVRRLHDVDKSGWFILVPVYNLILLCTEGTHGDNSYGQDVRDI